MFGIRFLSFKAMCFAFVLHITNLVREPEDDGGGTPQHSGVLPPVPSTSMSAPLPSASPVASYTQQVASPQSPTILTATVF